MKFYNFALLACLCLTAVACGQRKSSDRGFKNFFVYSESPQLAKDLVKNSWCSAEPEVNENGEELISRMTFNVDGTSEVEEILTSNDKVHMRGKGKWEADENTLTWIVPGTDKRMEFEAVIDKTKDPVELVTKFKGQSGDDKDYEETVRIPCE